MSEKIIFKYHPNVYRNDIVTEDEGIVLRSMYIQLLTKECLFQEEGSRKSGNRDKIVFRGHRFLRRNNDDSETLG